MQLRTLGRSDLKVSAIGLGVMNFGATTDERDARAQLDLAFESGVTLFDTAENYPAPLAPETQGRSEEILGRWIADRGVREQVVVATKVAGPGNAAGHLEYLRGPNRHLDAPNIRSAVDASLHRLGIEAIDLYQVHWPERPISTLGRTRYSLLPDTTDQVPIAQTLDALDGLVRAGKIRHIGVCNETAWGVMHWLQTADATQRTRIASIQNRYHLLDRQFEIALAEVAMREQVGLIAYSPLSRGLLTGKYRARSEDDPGRQRFSARQVEVAGQYAELAAKFGIDPVSLAIAYVRDKPFTTSVLCAASRVEQLERNLRAVEVEIPDEVRRAIDALHDAHPNPR